MSFSRVLGVVLGVVGLAQSRSLRGAYYNSRQISRALKSAPKKQRQYQPKDKVAAKPQPDDELHSMATWLTAHAMPKLNAKERGFVKNIASSLENNRQPSPKQEQWLRSIHSKHNPAGTKA